MWHKTLHCIVLMLTLAAVQRNARIDSDIILAFVCIVFLHLVTKNCTLCKRDTTQRMSPCVILWTSLQSIYFMLYLAKLITLHCLFLQIWSLMHLSWTMRCKKWVGGCHFYLRDDCRLMIDSLLLINDLCHNILHSSRLLDSLGLYVADRRWY